jgi:hypothetical protein
MRNCDVLVDPFDSGTDNLSDHPPDRLRRTYASFYRTAHNPVQCLVRFRIEYKIAYRIQCSGCLKWRRPKIGYPAWFQSRKRHKTPYRWRTVWALKAPCSRDGPSPYCIHNFYNIVCSTRAFSIFLNLKSGNHRCHNGEYVHKRPFCHTASSDYQNRSGS